LLWAAAGISDGLNPVFLIGIAVAAGQLAWQAACVDTNDPIDCLKKFRSNRMVGWMVFAGIVAGHLV
jgi:4-hydroxybenzoate polyprenyltransferase